MLVQIEQHLIFNFNIHVMRKLILFSIFIFLIQSSFAQDTYTNPEYGFKVKLNQGFSINEDTTLITLSEYMINDPYDDSLSLYFPNSINYMETDVAIESITITIDSLPDGMQMNCSDRVCQMSPEVWSSIRFTGTPTSPNVFDLTYKVSVVTQFLTIDAPKEYLPSFRFQPKEVIYGCMYANACNYNPQANKSDDSCASKISATVTNYSYEHQKVKVTSDSQEVNLNYKWYQGASLLTVSGDEFVPTQNGEYSVVVDDPILGDQACSDTVSFLVTKLNWDEIETMQIALYPNPSKDYLHLVTGDSHNVLNIELVDMVGHVLSKRVLRNVSNNQTIQFDVNHLSPGLYFVKVSTDKDVISTPWMKE